MKGKTVFKTNYFTVNESEIYFKTQEPYYSIECENGVIAAILDEQDQFILVKQFRPALSIETIEMPAGGIERNETPEEAIKREIEEEIQCESQLISIGSKYAIMSSRVNMYLYMYFGMRPTIVEKPNAGTENLEIIRMDRRKVMRKIQKGEITHLGAIGLLFMIEKELKIDLNMSRYEEIEKHFNRRLRN
tara:strand:- start:245 stop:814 length:570 start_codon:yes stop_codon:yes gene_type:complete